MTGWPFWHVTLTVAGEPVADAEIRVGLERLSHEHPFLLSGRWDDHRASAMLPDWHVVGIEVVDRDTFHTRGRTTLSPVSLVGVAPF